jgi:hypothetical protein
MLAPIENSINTYQNILVDINTYLINKIKRNPAIREIHVGIIKLYKI